ncbi:MAG: trypsin-like peptidase domain-containing protein [Candidatus Nanopelagicales bacterium]
MTYEHPAPGAAPGSGPPDPEHDTVVVPAAPAAESAPAPADAPAHDTRVYPGLGDPWSTPTPTAPPAPGYGVTTTGPGPAYGDPWAARPPAAAAPGASASSPPPYGSTSYGASPYGASPYGASSYGASPSGGSPSAGWHRPPPQAAPVPTAAADRPRRAFLGTAVLVAVIAGLLAGVVGGIAGYAIGTRADRSTLTSAGTVLPQVSGDTSPPAEGSVAAIVASVMPAVVSLEVTGSGGAGTGSGFVVREDGYLVTNNHVIALAVDGGDIEVVFADGESARGRVVGRNVSYDLAVVKVDRTGLPTVTLGDSEAVRVGDAVLAIGAPLGLTGTVTSGIVSALDRPVTAGGQGEMSYINAIQTDAAINPGNSGGPLLDGAGRVIGVNSAIATLAAGGEGGSIGLGFAIPVNQAKRIAEEIISTGDSSTPVIGVQLDLTYTGDGARIGEVTPGGPSERAGLGPGDVIVALDGRPVADSTELVVAIRARAPGDTVTLTIEDGDGTREVSVVLAADSEG